MAWELPAELQLPGERVALSKRANAILDPRAFGLTPFSRQMGPDAEGIGGHLALTQWRLVFSSHRLNRIVGAFSLALGDLVRTEDISEGVRRIVALHTRDGAEHRFLIWGIEGFSEALDAARSAFATSGEAPRFEAAVVEAPGRVESTLHVSASVTRFVRLTSLRRS